MNGGGNEYKLIEDIVDSAYLTEADIWVDDR